MTLWLNLLASLRKLEMLQINQEVVQDVRPPMKTQQLRYLQRLYRVPEKSTRRLSAESGVSRSSIRRILKANKWHPYKLHMAHHLSEDDPDRRMEFCEWALSNVNEDPNFSTKILFTDEANF